MQPHLQPIKVMNNNDEAKVKTLAELTTILSNLTEISLKQRQSYGKTVDASEEVARAIYRVAETVGKEGK